MHLGESYFVGGPEREKCRIKDSEVRDHMAGVIGGGQAIADDLVSIGAQFLLQQPSRVLAGQCSAVMCGVSQIGHGRVGKDELAVGRCVYGCLRTLWLAGPAIYGALGSGSSCF